MACVPFLLPGRESRGEGEIRITGEPKKNPKRRTAPEGRKDHSGCKALRPFAARCYLQTYCRIQSGVPSKSPTFKSAPIANMPGCTIVCAISCSVSCNRGRNPPPLVDSCALP